jgi:hypothetical protein
MLLLFLAFFIFLQIRLFLILTLAFFLILVALLEQEVLERQYLKREELVLASFLL